MKNDTKYASIYSNILKYIKENGLKSGDKLPTEKQFSDEFGVSRVTVRRAIQELSDRNVIYKIQGGGTYVGSSDPSKSTTSIQNIPFVICENVSSFAQIVQGAEKYLSQHQCYLTVHCSNDNFLNERNIINHLVDNQVKNMIVLPTDADKNTLFYFELMQKGINIVFVDLIPRGLVCHYVSSNNLMGGYQATKHLIQRGYRKIAFFSPSGDQYTTITDRKNGYLLALQEANIEPNPFYMPQLDNVCTDIPGVVKNLMTSPNPPDAFFAVNDIFAVNIFIAMQRYGYRVPEDAGIIGFDNLEMNVMQSVPLSTVSQNFLEIGRCAASMCLELSRRPANVFLRKVVPVTVIERMSTQRISHK